MANARFVVACVVLLQAAALVEALQLDEGAPPLDASATKIQQKSMKRAKANMAKANKANHTESELEKQYKNKAQTLKDMMEVYLQAKGKMEQAKREANEAKHLMQEEAARLAREEAERLAKIEAERQAVLEKQRVARNAIMEKADQVLNAAAASNETSILNGIPTSILVDMLLSLPAAVSTERFSSTVMQAESDMQEHVNDFLNVTNKKIALFVGAAQSASDAELAYSMAKFFHEAVARLKTLHKQALLVALRVKKVMPENLRKSMAPIVTQLSDNVVALKINASELAKGSLGDACDSVSEIMGNISDYDSKLVTVNEGIENATVRMLPMMDRIMPVSKNVTSFVENFISIAKMETAGLQQAANSIVTQVGPLVTDRVHCTWSAATSKFGLGVFSVVAFLMSIWNSF